MISSFLKKTLFNIQKPGRYVGGEFNQIKRNWENYSIKIALAFPDLYDIGLSNLGLSILYDIINQRNDALAERVYSPWTDMEEALRQERIPLFSMENRKPIKDFDMVGFSIPYETLYSNVLSMLDLAGIPIRSIHRMENDPLIIAGGHACFNPEPMHAFIDLFVIGEGEEIIHEIIDLLYFLKKKGNNRSEIITEIGKLDGIYNPSEFNISYNSDKTIKNITSLRDANNPTIVQKRIVKNLPSPLINFIVPNVSIIHERVVIEVMRGCSRGCRFCQAGMISRPVRERPVNEILNAVKTSVINTGFEEVSLLSLSTSDHSRIHEILKGLSQLSKDLIFNYSLPSLRIESFDSHLIDTMRGKRKGNFTLAPESASEKIRQEINKPITDQELLDAVKNIFDMGWKNLKLYFMIGFPGEDLEDVSKIIDLCQKVSGLAKQILKGKADIHVSINTLIPKPHTPFQWIPMDSLEIIQGKYQLIIDKLKKMKIKVDWSDYQSSFFEAWFSRGDRELSNVIETAWRKGAKFDAWQEKFNFKLWLDAFAENNIDPYFYSHRQRNIDEIFPWDHIGTGVSKKYLLNEYIKSTKLLSTDDCRINCGNCGIQTAFNLNCASIRENL